ncbi:MAG: zinc-finger domain-containing protein [Rhizomicrobium sp.]
MEQQNLPPVETVETSQSRVACDGGPLGHPKIYLEFAEADSVTCPYCGRRFVHPASGKSPV